VADHNFELENRLAGIGPVFVGSYRSGDKIEPWKIGPGNQISLKCDGITLTADVTEAKDDSFKGVIIGFENFMDESYHGKKVGDEIPFQYQHIIGCSR
jgi:hypothetical protein